MKFGHPRVYNPFQSEEYNELQRQAEELTDILNSYLQRIFEFQDNQRIVFAQIRDCILTRDEQVARLNALDEVGAPR